MEILWAIPLKDGMGWDGMKKWDELLSGVRGTLNRPQFLTRLPTPGPHPR
jgi:hypothetical protein